MAKGTGKKTVLRKVEIRNFKLFEEQVFDLPEHLVVVGPNNSGKTSLLQAVAAWSEIANHWFETNPGLARLEDGTYATADLNMLRFDAVPLRDFPHLWRNKLTAGPIGIWLDTGSWRVGFEVMYSANELVTVRPMKDVTEWVLHRCSARLPNVIYVAPVSRLRVTEAPYTEDGVRARLRRGRLPEVLRNVLAFVSRDPAKWAQLQAIVHEFFGYELLRPTVGADVVARYRHRPNAEEYDLSAAASGFLQLLASYAALLFDEASVILVDEPDAHLHLLLQETAYRKLRAFAAQTNSQLIVATHSEVVIRKAPPEDLRLLWRGFRGLGLNKNVSDVLRLENEALMLAETEPGVLYVEGDSDVDNLREWAQVLGHPVFRFLNKPFWKATASSPKKGYAASHFSALREMVPAVRGVELRDGDQSVPKRGPAGLLRLRWRQTEIENYLVQPAVLERFVLQERDRDSADRVRKYMERSLPPVLFEAPADASAVVESMKGSDVLSKILQEAGLTPKKTDYWRIAAQMRPEEVHPEVVEKLDAIAAHFEMATGEI